jgi:hypothetical protein
MAGAAAIAFADDGDGEGDCDEATDEGCHSGGSPGEKTDPSYRIPCFISDTAGATSGYRELIVGRHWTARLATGSTQNEHESFYNSAGTADCGWGDLVTGTGHITTSFFIRLASWYAYDGYSAGAATITETFSADWYASSDCTGTATSLGTTKSFSPTAFGVSEQNWESADKFDTGSTATGRGFVVAAPSAGVTRSVKFTISGTIDGTTLSEDGCFAYQG